MMRILGIDPGLSITGYGLIEDTGTKIKLIEAGVIRTSSDKAISDRLFKIYDGLSEVIEEFRPEILVLEKVYSHYRHPVTSILMGHARGVILLSAARLGMEVRSYAATHIKRYLTGNGRATKGQVQRAIQTALGLSTLPEPSDLADAMAIAMCCAGDISAKRPMELVS